MEFVVDARLDRMSFLGRRVAATERWILGADLEPRLAGYRAQPGAHPWIGEHIGKWIDAATLLWQSSRDTTLGAKLDWAVRELIAAQQSDGYLGTYAPAVRYSRATGAGWDVWSAKYCLLGLLSYYEATGYEPALAAGRRLADLLIARFGPGRRDILRSDQHQGLASSSVLLPITRLARITRDSRYLEFASHIIARLDSATGPRMRPTLLAGGGVANVGNAKAYEMLSCIHGMLEYGLLSDDASAIAATITAWEDIREHHLYVTGTASYGEHFHHSEALPASPIAHMGETCVTTTWIQLSLALYRTTVETRYLEEVERSLLNHLAAAQNPDGKSWCYYLPLQGSRKATEELACCSSSGPRGFALAASAVFGVDDGMLTIGLLQSAEAEVTLDGCPMLVSIVGDFPFGDHATITFTPARNARFAVQIRRPEWADGMTVEGTDAANPNGWFTIPARTWQAGDSISVHIPVRVRRIAGIGWNAGRSALAQGPLILAYSPTSNWPAYDTAATGDDLPTPLRADAGSCWHLSNPIDAATHIKVLLMPFADAAHAGGSARTWIEDGRRGDVSLFLRAAQTVSGGHDDAAYAGSALDGDRDNAALATGAGGIGEDTLEWVAANLDYPVEFRRIVVRHGISSGAGGWFDTGLFSPEVQVRRTPQTPWETVAVLDDYPLTTTIDDSGLEPGRAFEIHLSTPILATGLRVRGVGSFGRSSIRRSISIGELAAYAT